MQNEKSWYASKSINGSLVALVAAIVLFFDVDLGQLQETLVELTALAGAVLGIVGRVVATAEIKKKVL